MISVIMGAYNAKATIARAILSVTDGDFKDVEFIVCDDGSTDGTSEIIDALAAQDNRVKVVRHATNMGLSRALNDCLRGAKYDFIARMDADDVSHSDRLTKELNLLTSRDDLSFVAAAVNLFDDNGMWGKRRFPQAVTTDTLLAYNPFIHPTMLFRKQALLAVGGYRDLPYTYRCEDYDLVFRLYASGFIGENTDEVLYDYYESQAYAKKHTLQTRLNECKVRRLGAKALKAGLKGFILSFKPIILFFLPRKAYALLHSKRWLNKA